MAGKSPKLPLYRDSQDGYALNKTLRAVARQNLKMVILTSPGERIMIPDFGVGIRQYLFENYTNNLARSFKARLFEQVKKYLPLVEIVDVKFLNSAKEDTSNSSLDPNVLAIEISYAITNLNIYDSLFIEDITIGL